MVIVPESELVKEQTSGLSTITKVSSNIEPIAGLEKFCKLSERGVTWPK